MKKLLILLLLFIFSIFSFKIVALAIPQTIDYEVSYYEGFKYDLNDGLLKTDVGYISTSVLPLFNYSTGFVNYNFHHVLFWDSNGNYLGYYNTDKTNLQNEFYLGDILDDEISKPTNASKMAFMSNYAGTVTYTQFNNRTLEEVFYEYSIYKVSNLLTDGGFSNNNNYTIINNATLEDGFITFGSSSIVRVLNPFTMTNNKYYSVIFSAKRDSLSGNINLSFQNIPFSAFYGFLYNVSAQSYFQMYDFTSKASYTFTVSAIASSGNTVLDYIFIYDRDYILSILPDYTDVSLRNVIKNSINTNGYKDTIFLPPFYNNKPSTMSNLEFESWYEVYNSLGSNYPIQISKEEFMQINPFYLYQIETPKTAINFNTILDNMFNIQGFSGSFVKMIISAIIIGGAVFMLAMYKAGGLLILGVAGIIYTGLAIIGWLPQAPILIMGLGLLALIILKFVKGGGGSDEE